MNLHSKGTGVKTGAILQARMSSSRLPGKVLEELAGKTVLSHVVSRARRIPGVELVAVATSVEESDNVIARWCESEGVACFRGPLRDVLKRYSLASDFFALDAVVRITADCPLLDPEISGQVVRKFHESGADLTYLSGNFPDGLDTQVFSRRALQVADLEATRASDREHVGPYIESRTSRFKVNTVEPFRDEEGFRWTLDEEADLIFLRELAMLSGGELCSLSSSEIMGLIATNSDNPKLVANRHITRNEGYLRSLANEENSG